MSKTLAKFGELSIQAASSLDNDSMENDEKFSTIDLNGGSTSPSHRNVFFKNNASNKQTDESNESIYSGGGVTNGSMNGYLSFGEQSSSGQNGITCKKHPNVSNGIHSNTTFEGLDNSYPSLSESISNPSFKANSTSFQNNLTPVSMISNAGDASSKFIHKTTTTFETIKAWSKSAYKCTKQIVSEKLGKAQRTVDPELEATIEHLRDLKKKYENVLGLSSSLSTYFSNIVSTQRQLGDSFADLAQKSPELIDEFNANAQTQRNLARHADTLISNYFFENKYEPLI